jgi:ABC-type microcin C transport system permease subunit YejE
MNLYMILNAPVDKISYSLHEIQDYTQTYKQDEIENGAYAMLGLKPKNYTLLNGNLGPVEETCQYASKQILVLYRTRYGVWTDVGDIYTPEALKITDCKEN